MNRGRSDINDKLRRDRLTGGTAFHGNSSIVARACERFFADRGIVTGGMAGIMRAEIKVSRRPGRVQRDNKIDSIAADLEQAW